MGYGRVTQWDASAKKWVQLTDFIAPDEDVVWPLIEADAASFRDESGMAQRDCK